MRITMKQSRTFAVGGHDVRTLVEGESYDLPSFDAAILIDRNAAVPEETPKPKAKPAARKKVKSEPDAEGDATGANVDADK